MLAVLIRGKQLAFGIILYIEVYGALFRGEMQRKREMNLLPGKLF
jgi:hypothetical protein